RRSVYALAAVMTIAWAILEAAFWRSDFTFNVVAQHSSTTTPAFYKLAAPWSSQEGSLLLWVWLLSLWSSLILFLTRRRVREIAPYATAVLLGFAAFFTSLAAFFANPFATSAQPPTEGAGLDPLLLHPSMMIHAKRGMLKAWNVSLVLASGTLAVLGTFLVRSGILDSSHAFGASTLGVPFVVLLAVMVTGSMGLVLWRRSRLRSEAQLDSL